MNHVTIGTRSMVRARRTDTVPQISSPTCLGHSKSKLDESRFQGSWGLEVEVLRKHDGGQPDPDRPFTDAAHRASRRRIRRYQGQPEIAQYNVNNNQAYIFSDPVTGQPLMPITSSDQDCLLVFDGLNNPVGLLTDFATNAFTYQYDPWGVQVLTAGGTGNGAAQNPYAFHAGIKDKGSGLVKFGLRWYNPVTGTWTQQDTLDQPLDLTNGNRYAYVGDDPTNNMDPGGLACTPASVIGEVSGAGGIGAIGGGAIGAGIGLLGGPFAEVTVPGGALVGGIIGGVVGAVGGGILAASTACA
jgi:RHS repeat-associated protein